jgi:hypothetical protein
MLRARFHVSVPAAHTAGPLLAAAAGACAVLAVRPWAGGAVPLAAGLLVYAGALGAWLAATGQRLALTGFTAEAPPLSAPAPAPEASSCP